MTHRLIVLLLAAGLAVAACGESEEDKAKAQVCDARADIQKQVDELQGLTRSTATVDGVTKNLQAIRADLRKIRDAQGNLNDERKKQVQDANQAFEQQVRSTVQNVGKSLSVSDAQTQLRSAVTDLANSYKQTLGKVDCS
jgi:Tfp pilus assembly protein PilP